MDRVTNIAERQRINGDKSGSIILSTALLCLCTQAVCVQTTSAADSSKASGQVALEEIVVTAERREENLQKAAVAVTALTADELTAAAIFQPESLNRLVPGIGISQTGPNTQVYLRGVGNFGTTMLADPAVAFNVDGIYVARTQAFTGEFYDLARVEVLKGPQGTLYGRNATGGAINVISNKPDRQFAGSAGLEYGNYNLLKVNGMLNVPLSDAWAMRGAFQTVSRSGYLSDGGNDDQTQSGRLQTLYQPDQNFSLLLSGSYSHRGGTGEQAVPYLSATADNGGGFVNPSKPYQLNTALVNQAYDLQHVFGFEYPIGLSWESAKQDIRVSSLSAQLDWKLGINTLTVIANDTKTQDDVSAYPVSGLDWTNDSATQVSLEARLAGATGPLSWIAGAYYFNERQRSNFWLDLGQTFTQIGFITDPLKDKTTAAFAQLRLALSERFRVTGGGRYTYEKKSVDGASYNSSAVGCGGTVLSSAQVINAFPFVTSGLITGGDFCREPMTGEKSWNKFNWKAGLEFDVTDQSLLYANVSTGFKAGGFFPAPNNAQVGNTYEPETLTAYALGSKNRFANGRLQLNGEAFYYDYKGHQESFLGPLDPSIGPVPFGQITINSGKAEVYGLDLDIDALLTDHDELALRGEYLHARYTEFSYLSTQSGEVFGGGPHSSPPDTLCSSNFIQIGLYSVDCSGQQMPRSPDLSLAAEYHHTFPLASGATLAPGLRGQYVSSQVVAVDYAPLEKRPSYAKFDIDLTYQSRDQRWSSALYVNNVADKVVIDNVGIGPAGPAFVQLAPPRTYGARLQAKF